MVKNYDNETPIFEYIYKASLDLILIQKMESKLLQLKYDY